MEQFLVVIYSWALKTRKTRTNRLKKSWWLKQNSFWWLFTVGLWKPVKPEQTGKKNHGGFKNA